jgi:hypothetical protein
MSEDVRSENRWLERLVGDWTWEAETVEVPGMPASKVAGRETARALGAWVVCEGEGEMPDGGRATSLMSLGFDPERGRVVGTFIASAMAHLWIYDGALDAPADTLRLDTEGPGFEEGTTTAKYVDEIAFQDDDHRTLTSRFLALDGTWRLFMTSHYRRVR